MPLTMAVEFSQPALVTTLIVMELVVILLQWGAYALLKYGKIQVEQQLAQKCTDLEQLKRVNYNLRMELARQRPAGFQP